MQTLTQSQLHGGAEIDGPENEGPNYMKTIDLKSQNLKITD